jgi:hypothetical protein
VTWLECAPVALFAFRRPVHLSRTLSALRRNQLAAQTDLFVFIDRPRASELEAVNKEVVDVASAAEGFRSVTIVRRERHFGLSENIVCGVTELADRHGRVIVVEDDLVTSPHFLEFMNRGLETYANDPSVASIHGWMYPMSWKLPETFFLRGADCWGWATWRDRWAAYQRDGDALLSEIRSRRLRLAFNQYGAYPYEAMLERQVKGLNDSWAIRWHASCFLRDWVTLYPGRSLVLNIGHDGNGATHSAVTAQFDGDLSPSPVVVKKIPVRPNRWVLVKIIAYLMKQKLIHALHRD